jgi:hypothetical protein
MFDIFYYGKKPNLFAFERQVSSIEEAQHLSKTKFYWYIYGGNDYTNFDFTWKPAPWESHHVHVFASQWQSNGDVYLCNKETELDKVKKTEWHFRTEQKVTRLPDVANWKFLIPNLLFSDNIDFSWHPNSLDPPYVYHFASQHQPSCGLVYQVPGATQIKFCQDFVAQVMADKSRWQIPDNIDDSTFDYSWHPNAVEPNYEYRFGTQWQRNGGPVYPGTAGIKHISDQKVIKLADRSKWIIPEGIDDSEFDYSWHPDATEPDYEYHFPTQWQRDGGPIYRGNAGIKFVSDQKIRAGTTQIFYMDFLNDRSQEQFEALQYQFPDIKLTRYVDNHLNVFKRIVNLATTEFVWIISSICDYCRFDFTWHPDPSQREMIHVFPSGTQRRGDTFYIHIESLRRQLYELELLDWFNVINYCDDQVVYRFEHPVIIYEEDSLVEPVKNTAFNFPYAMFCQKKEVVRAGAEYVYPCLWAAKDRTIEPITSNKCNSLIPREARSYVQTQIYDYPYINKDNTVRHPNEPLDIIFISNREPDEELMFHHTEYMTNSDVKWIRNVDGRVAAYQAAARASATPWFFAVFAKLEVVGNTFPWNEWQPDYWQQPKHYIFNARNPVNGLEYGHQGMIAYNKKLVLENNTPGIDFTLSQSHEVVPLLSGVARFNQDPWTTWRTAFREVVKLKYFMITKPTLETKNRLDTWLTVANGDFAEWCLRGAADAVNYYNEVNGEYEKLILSFEWAWLRERFNILYTV